MGTQVSQRPPSSHRLAVGVAPALAVTLVLLLPGLAAAATVGISGGTLTYTGSNVLANNLTVTVSGANYSFNDTAETISFGFIEAILGCAGNGSNTVTCENVDVTAIVINVQGGADTLSIGSATDPVTINGGDGADTITITSAPSTVTVNAGLGADTINLRGNDGVVTINGDDGSDTVTLASTTLFLSDIDANVTVNGNAGTDTLTVNDSGSTPACGAETITVTSTSVTGITTCLGAAGGAINYATIEQLHALGHNAANTYVISSTNVAVTTTVDAGTAIDTVSIRGNDGPLTFNAGGGDDVITIATTAPANVSNIDADVTVNGDAGTDTLTIDDSGSSGAAETITVQNSFVDGITTFNATVGGRINYGTIEQLTLSGNNAANTHVIEGTSSSTTTTVNGGSVIDTVLLRGNDGPLTFNGNAGNDTVTMATTAPANVSNIDADVTINGNAGTDTLTVNDSGSGGAAETITITSSFVDGITAFNATTGGRINYGTVEQLTVDGNPAANTWAVQSTSAATTVNALAGSDTVTVASPTNNVSGVAGELTISGGGGTNTLNINDSGSLSTLGDTVTVTNAVITGITAFNGGASANINYSSIATLTVSGNRSGCTFTIGVTTAGQTTTVNGGILNDTINASTSNGAITLNGGAGNDTITGGTGTNTITGGDGDDTVNVAAAAVSTADGNPNTDTLNFDAASQPVVAADPAYGEQLATYAPTPNIPLPNGTLSVGGSIRVTYSNFEGVTVVNGLSQPPAIDITSPTTLTTFTATSAGFAMGGTASDDVGVTQVRWVNDRGGSGIALGTTTWSAAGVLLQPGVNVLTVTALDGNGNQTNDTLTVTVNSFTYTLAEGATGPFFEMDVLLANPNAVVAPVTLTYLKEDGSTVNQALTLLATSTQAVRVNGIAGLETGAVSTVVTSTTPLPLIVERTMYWDANHYGGHGGTAVDGSATTWYFGEGSQGFFDTYVLLANSSAGPANVTVDFLTEFSGTVTRNYTVNATSRMNVFTGLIPELVNTSFSIRVTSDIPIISERAMYFGTSRFWDGGHESAGVSAPALSWFHAEGATGAFFDTYILIGNPNGTAASVTMTFLLASGATVVRAKTVPANGRLTVNVEAEDALLADAAVSTTVTSDLPVISERAMYWQGAFTSWYEAHNSFGVTQTSTKWGLSEGRVGGAEAFDTFILLANPSGVAADVQITFLKEDGTTVVKTFSVAATSRFNVWVNTEAPELANSRFGAIVEVTNGVEIAVERAMYWNAFGQTWAAGTNATATRLR